MTIRSEIVKDLGIAEAFARELDIFATKGQDIDKRVKAVGKPKDKVDKVLADEATSYLTALGSNRLRSSKISNTLSTHLRKWWDIYTVKDFNSQADKERLYNRALEAQKDIEAAWKRVPSI